MHWKKVQNFVHFHTIESFYLILFFFLIFWPSFSFTVKWLVNDDKKSVWWFLFEANWYAVSRKRNHEIVVCWMSYSSSTMVYLPLIAKIFFVWWENYSITEKLFFFSFQIFNHETLQSNTIFFLLSIFFWGKYFLQ